MAHLNLLFFSGGRNKISPSVSSTLSIFRKYNSALLLFGNASILDTIWGDFPTLCAGSFDNNASCSNFGHSIFSAFKHSENYGP